MLAPMNRLVAIAMPPGKEFVAELRRVLDDNDACLPLDMRLSPTARGRVIAAMRPGCLVEESGERRRVPGGQPVEAGDALVMATSGTTGEPKGVVLTREAVAASARATNARLGIGEGDRLWACLPLAHIGGLSVVLRALEAGASLEVSPFSLEAARSALSAGATVTSLVATALSRLGPGETEAFRWIVLGGSRPPEVVPDNVVTTYGMTETGSGVVYDGSALDGVEVKVHEMTGEILLKGPMLLRTYRDGNDPKTKDGWLPTGDAGEIGPDGRLRVHGRIGEIIITGGENVWPAQVERVLEGHPALGAVAVCGRPDPEWGERVTAYVELSRGIEAAELLSDLRELVRHEIAPFAAPRQVVVVEKLPRTSLGKVRKDVLSELDGPSASI